jgi:hypothetical protein
MLSWSLVFVSMFAFSVFTKAASLVTAMRVKPNWGFISGSIESISLTQTTSFPNAPRLIFKLSLSGLFEEMRKNWS